MTVGSVTSKYIVRNHAYSERRQLQYRLRNSGRIHCAFRSCLLSFKREILPF